MKLCGIDESGRGPLLGPMVLAGVCASEKELKNLEKLPIKDSKLLSKKKREELFKKITSKYKYVIVKVLPKEIDDYNFRGVNLNNVEAKTIARIILEMKPDKVIVDSPEPADEQKFGRTIKEFCKEFSFEISSEHKADLNHKIAGAASILAKVTRDNEIEKIKKETGIDIGSGYPSDEVTQKAIKEHFSKLEKYMRKCWSTYKRLKGENFQSNLGEY